MTAAKIGKEKTGGCKGCDLKPHSTEFTHRQQVRGQGNCRRQHKGEVDSKALGWKGRHMGQIRPDAKQGHLIDCFLSFQRFRQVPSPSFFIMTTQRQKTLPPYPSNVLAIPHILHNVLILFSSAFITFISHTQQQSLSHWYYRVKNLVRQTTILFSAV